MRKNVLGLLAAVVFFASVTALRGDTIGTTVDDPLHGFCWGGSTCTDNGTNTPTSTDPPNFGFWITPGPQKGTYFIDILVPKSAVPGDPSLISYAISGDLSGTATLFSSSAWSTGFLDSYLGFSASPANPCGAYQLNASNPTQSTGCAISYYVYQVDLGTATLKGSATGSPDLTITGGVPTDSYIVGFLDTSTTTCKTKKGVTTCTTTYNNVATANSGAILEDGNPPTTVAEPGSLMLFGTGLLSMAGFLRRKLFS